MSGAWDNARFRAQRAEFDAAAAFAEQMRRIQMTPIVDDDYPSVRSDYERAAAKLFQTFVANGRGSKRGDIEQQALVGLQAAQRLAHETATNAGWYTDPATKQPIARNFGEVVALMHSELSEALEADRKGLKDQHLPHRDGREVEFADCIIRILDTAAALGLDIAGAVIEKNRFNRERADHKLANRAASGGKKY